MLFLWCRKDSKVFSLGIILQRQGATTEKTLFPIVTCLTLEAKCIERTSEDDTCEQACSYQRRHSLNDCVFILLILAILIG